MGTLSFTTDDLAHALFATGRAPGDQWAHSMASVWEWIHRTSLIPAYIRRTPRGRVVRSDLALELDRSEKVGVSYAIGQAMTNIFCEKLLSANFLMHIDRYASRYGVTFGPTRKRADLFGPDLTGQWIVAEAKGRSNSMESDLPQTLIDQKRSISLVAGSVPRLSLGCVASFPPYARELEVDAFDPDEDATEAIQLDIKPDLYFLAYYEPFIAAIDFGVTRDQPAGDEEMIFSTLPQAGLRIGVLRAIADRIRGATQQDATGLADSIRSVLEHRSSTAGFADGTSVETDWEDYLSLSDWGSYE